MEATALIADDEPLLAQAMQAELAALWPELTVLTVAPNGLQAQQDALSLKPDVAFLDIRMPGATGMEVARALAEDWPDDSHPPLLVFVTAYEQFALDAFRQAAVDYVLKPVQRDRLEGTIRRLKQRLSERMSDRMGLAGRSSADELAAQLQRLLAGSGTQVGRAGLEFALPVKAPKPPERLHTIRAAVGNIVRLVSLQDVIYLRATDKYVSVVTTDRELLIREPLRDLVPRLDPLQFTQVHRSTVVNLNFVQAAFRDEAGKLWLTLRARAEHLAVSRIYAHLFRAM